MPLFSRDRSRRKAFLRGFERTVAGSIPQTLASARAFGDSSRELDTLRTRVVESGRRGALAPSCAIRRFGETAWNVGRSAQPLTHFEWNSRDGSRRLERSMLVAFSC